MINAIAIDDEPPALHVLENFCSKIDSVDLQKVFNKPTEGLQYLSKFPVDLVFLDINMPALNGIDLFKTIQQRTMVIFTTAHSEYAVEGFNLNAIDYLLKPFTFERFQQAVVKAHDFFNLSVLKGYSLPEHLFIRANYSLHKIAFSDILVIEGLDDYVKIYTDKAKPLVARMTIKVLLEKLPQSKFMRVHRSYIVNLSHITRVRFKIISVADKEIPIGASYEKKFFEHFKT